MRLFKRLYAAGFRQEKLEQLAIRYHRKAGMRESWLNENQRLVSQDNFGYDLAAVEAATKKHEAIETDINAYEERVQAVVAVANELEAENFHDIERINARQAPHHSNPVHHHPDYSVFVIQPSLLLADATTCCVCGTICSSCCARVARDSRCRCSCTRSSRR